MQDNDALSVFEQHGPTLTAQIARQHGLHWEDLYRLRDADAIDELSRGVFRLATAPPVEQLDVVAVLARAPKAIACLATAASIWELTDEIPRTVHIAVARGTHRPRIDWPSTTVHVFKTTTFDVGQEKLELSTGEAITLYSPERTVVDIIRLAHRESSEPLGELINRYLRRTGATPAKLLDMARKFNAVNSVRRILEVVVP